MPAPFRLQDTLVSAFRSSLLYRLLNSKLKLLFWALCVLIFGVFGPLFAYRNARLITVPSQQFPPANASTPDGCFTGYSPIWIASLGQQWDASQRQLYYVTQFTLDLLFPLAYATAIYLLGWLLLGAKHQWWNYFSRGPAAAVLFDYLENITCAICIYYADASEASWFTFLAKIASALTVLKWSIVAALATVPVLAFVIVNKRLVNLAISMRFPVLAIVTLSGMSFILCGRADGLQTNVMYVESLLKLTGLAAFNLLAIVTSVVIARKQYESQIASGGPSTANFRLQPWPNVLYFECTILAAITPGVACYFSAVEGLREASTWGVVCSLLGLALGWCMLFGLESVSHFIRARAKRKFTKGYYFPFSKFLEGGTRSAPMSAENPFDWQLAVVLFFLVLILWTPLQHLLGGIISVAALVVLVMWITTMLLSGIGACVDSWRIPVLGLLILWIAFSRLLTSDHRDVLTPSGKAMSGEQRSEIQQNASAPDGTDLPEEESPPAQTVYVVTCPGGGIHAAAWSHKVLTELARHKSFKGDLKFVSAVSGGAVGSALFIAEQYTTGSQTPPLPSGGLAAVAKGFVQGDMAATIWPATTTEGRGLRFEQYVASELADRVASSSGTAVLTPTMKDWEALSGTGTMPGICFGSMDILSGRRTLFSTVPVQTGENAISFRQLATSGKGAQGAPDLTVAAAVRVSASFPFVSPPVSVHGANEELALADGGYVDNEGIITAIQWIRTPGVIRESDRVFLIRIQPSGARAVASKRSSRIGSAMRWLLGPLEGIISMRTASQRERGELEVDLLGSQVTTVVVPFEIKDYTPPLSWTLTPRQAKTYATAWDNIQAQVLNQLQLPPNAAHP